MSCASEHMSDSADRLVSKSVCTLSRLSSRSTVLPALTAAALPMETAPLAQSSCTTVNGDQEAPPSVDRFSTTCARRNRLRGAGGVVLDEGFFFVRAHPP